MKPILIVFLKELRDGLRDRKTLATLLLTSIAIGPIMLLALSHIVADLEARAERRDVMVHNIVAAPEIENFLKRLSYTVSAAPPDYEQQLRSGKLQQPVIVIPSNYAAKRLEGNPAEVEVLYDSGQRNTVASLGRALGALNGFNAEQRAQALAVRNVPLAQLNPLKVEQVDLASAAKRSGQFTNMVGYFVLAAVLLGAMALSLDSTAGERERGSLEPLLANPVSTNALAIGKWMAAAAFAMAFAAIAVLSFLPGQWLIRSEALAANFNFGGSEALKFLALLVPLAAALPALMMAISIRCKTFKEAQAANSVLLLVANLLPMASWLDPSGERPWHYLVPVLGQNAAMGRVVKGEPLDAFAMLAPFAICVMLTALGLAFVSRSMRALAARG